MTRTVKTLSLLLALLFAASLFACGKTQNADVPGSAAGSDDRSQNEPAPSGKTWYLGGKSILFEDLDVEKVFAGYEDTVDPGKIYSSVGFTESMLHGSYTLNKIDRDVDEARKTVPFEDIAFSNGTYSVSSVPIGVFFGKENVTNTVIYYEFSEYKQITDREIAVLQFLLENDIGRFICVYEIDGDELVFKGIEQTSKDDEPFAYKETGEVFRYKFELRGPYLTLSKGDAKITLIAYGLSDNVDAPWLAGYSLPDSPLVGELDYFSTSNLVNYAVKRNGDYYKQSAYKIDSDGRFSIYLTEKDADGNITEYHDQFACVIQSEAGFLADFGVILLDGEHQYMYTDNITKREARVLEEQGADPEEVGEEKIKEIAEKTNDLFDDLMKEFEKNGIGVSINRSSGEISMDASVLFGGDSAEITAEGKELLNKFLEAYVPIISNEKYKGFISKTVVEGHTAPIAGSTYESGLPLSVERAENVKAYCLSGESGIDPSSAGTVFEAVGLSNSKPAYGPDGEVDLNASRRVSFRFIVNLD